MTESQPHGPIVPGPVLEPPPGGGVAFHERVPTPDRRSTGARLGIIAGSGLLIAVGIVAAMGASPSPATGADPSTAASPAPDASGNPDRTGKWRLGAGPLGDIGRLGFGRGPMADGLGIMGFGDITITAITGDSLSLETVDGWTRTIQVSAETAISRGGATITLSDLAVGDQIRFRQTKADDGSYQVTAIVVVLPTVAGQVSAIAGNTITITLPGGTTQTVHVDGDTTYRVNGESASLSDLQVGSIVVAEGTQWADGSLDAATIRGGTFDHDRLPFRHDGPADPDASPAPTSNAG